MVNLYECEVKLFIRAKESMMPNNPITILLSQVIYCQFIDYQI